MHHYKAMVRMCIALLTAQVIAYYVLTKGTEFIALAIIMIACWVALEWAWH